MITTRLIYRVTRLAFVGLMLSIMTACAVQSKSSVSSSTPHETTRQEQIKDEVARIDKEIQKIEYLGSMKDYERVQLQNEKKEKIKEYDKASEECLARSTTTNPCR